MDVSENNGTPKSSILIGFSIINHPFWGTPIFGNTHMLYDLLVFEPPSFLRPLFRFGRSTSRIRVIWRSWRIAFISFLIVIIPCDGHERCAPCIICILRVSRNIACQPVKLVEMVVLLWLTRRPASEMSVTSCDSGNLK